MVEVTKRPARKFKRQFQPRVDGSVPNVEAAGLSFAVHSFFNERQDMRMTTNSTSVKCLFEFNIKFLKNPCNCSLAGRNARNGSKLQDSCCDGEENEGSREHRIGSEDYMEADRQGKVQGHNGAIRCELRGAIEANSEAQAMGLKRVSNHSEHAAHHSEYVARRAIQMNHRVQALCSTACYDYEETVHLIICVHVHISSLLPVCPFPWQMTPSEECLRWMNWKVLEHEGFQGTSSAALDVMMGSGVTRIQGFELYIKDNIVWHSSRLADLEKKLVGAHMEVLDNDALFAGEDNEEDESVFVIGGFSDSLGDDFLGLQELGIAAELGLSSLTIPKKLLKGKSQGTAGTAIEAKPKEPPPPYPLLPSLLPITSKNNGYWCLRTRVIMKRQKFHDARVQLEQILVVVYDYEDGEIL
ncbi:hypothetical protein EDD22DRAFT_1053500 [Suillus occidentalis]|nr:hypothetical protein EDD22DRAFT_1053500 [Suillus occidentalis]